MSISDLDKITVNRFFSNLNTQNHYLLSRANVFTQRRRIIISNYFRNHIYPPIVIYDFPNIPTTLPEDSTFPSETDFNEPLNALDEEFYDIYYPVVSSLSTQASAVLTIVTPYNPDRYTLMFFDSIIHPISYEDAFNSFTATKDLETNHLGVNEIGHFWQYLTRSLKADTGEEQIKIKNKLGI